MKNEIKVPGMGESITEVIIGNILIPSGSAVQVDDPILELETDKVNQLLYAPQAGNLTLTVKSGETVRIGQAIGHVDTEILPSQAIDAATQPLAVADNSENSEKKPEMVPEYRDEKKSEIKPIPAVPSETIKIRQTQEDFLRELVHEDLYSGQKNEQLETKPALKEAVKEGKQETRRRMSTIRRVIAKRLVEAQHAAAMLTTFNEIDLSQVIQLREKYKESFSKKHGVKLGFMSFFIKASVAALKMIPDLNSYIDGEDIVHREYYDIGVAIGTDKGLVVPVIRDCEKLSFAQVEQAIEEYAKKTREGKIAINDLQGGGFTITNGGVYGSLLSTPILNPPQSGILGMHKIEKRPVVVEDQIVIRPMMYVALSYDHRIVDGKEAVSFLIAIKNALEDPARLMLDL